MTLVSYKKDEPSPHPTISGFSPSSGIDTGTATTVIIIGTNFSATATANEVKFNVIAAKVSLATTTQLTTSVPVGATTGKITVRLNGNTATSATDFEVIIDIPRNGLVAFYPFKGNANDASGNNLNGVLTNGPTLS